MSPTRRVLLATLAGCLTANAGCQGSPNDPSSSDGSATATASDQTTRATSETPALELTASDPTSVSADATLAAVGALPDDLDAITAGDSPESDLDTVRQLDCFIYRGGAYEIEARHSDGGYLDEYSVEQVESAGDREIVTVENLSADRRETVSRLIERGSYTYRSEDGGFQPRQVAYRYEGTLYVFRYEFHADQPTVTRLSVEPADEEQCPVIESLGSTAASRLAELVESTETFPVSVPAEVVPDVAPYDYVVTVERVLAVRTRR